jgi:hypothetical protein
MLSKRRSMQTKFDLLPTELVGVILSFCEEKEKVICKQINKTVYHTLIYNPSLCIGSEILNMEVLFGKEVYIEEIEFGIKKIRLEYSFEGVKNLDWKKFKHIKLIRFSSIIDFDDLLFFLKKLENVSAVILYNCQNRDIKEDVETIHKIERTICVHLSSSLDRWRTPLFSSSGLGTKLINYFTDINVSSGEFCYLCKRKSFFDIKKIKHLLIRECTDCKNTYCEECLFDSKNKCRFKYSNYSGNCCLENMSKLFKCFRCLTIYNISGTVIYHCSVCKADVCAKCMRFCEECRNRICCEDVCKCGSIVPPLPRNEAPVCYTIS